MKIKTNNKNSIGNNGLQLNGSLMNFSSSIGLFKFNSNVELDFNDLTLLLLKTSHLSFLL